MGPKVNRSTPYKLCAIFVVEIMLVAVSLLALAHGSWNHQTWKMFNNHELTWHTSLSRISSRCNCEGYPAFHYTCMSVFKGTTGNIWSVRARICSLPTADLKVLPKYQPSIRAFGASCRTITTFARISTITLAFMLGGAVSLAASFLSLLKWCDRSFAPKSQIWYWVSLSLLILAPILMIAAAGIYSLGMQGTIGDIFNYVNSDKPAASPIQKAGNGSYGWGFILTLFAILTHIILIFLWLIWVPQEYVGDQQKYRPVPKTVPPRRKMREAEKDAVAIRRQSPEKKVFWAYMPEVFQPMFGGPQYFPVQQEQMPLMTHQPIMADPVATVSTTYLHEQPVAHHQIVETTTTTHHHPQAVHYV